MILLSVLYRFLACARPPVIIICRMSKYALSVSLCTGNPDNFWSWIDCIFSPISFEHIWLFHDFTVNGYHIQTRFTCYKLSYARQKTVMQMDESYRWLGECLHASYHNHLITRSDTSLFRDIKHVSVYSILFIVISLFFLHGLFVSAHSRVPNNGFLLGLLVVNLLVSFDVHTQAI